MINYIFAVLVLAGFVFALINGSVGALGQAAMDAAGEAVTMCLGLIGSYALWLGLINIFKEAGVLEKFSSGLYKVIGKLFRGVKRGSEAAQYIALNLAANMLGIGNAATPFGLKAMQQLQEQNEDKRTASDAMCMFIVINASSVQLLPLNVIALRNLYGSSMSAAIILPALIATGFSTLVGILAVRVLERRM